MAIPTRTTGSLGIINRQLFVIVVDESAHAAVAAAAGAAEAKLVFAGFNPDLAHFSVPTGAISPLFKPHIGASGRPVNLGRLPTRGFQQALATD